MANDHTGGDMSITGGDNDNFGGLKIVSDNDQETANSAGTDDAGEDGEDADILGKKQEDLGAEDLAGDARSDDPHKTENAAKAGRDIDTDAGQE